jgi:cation diffusion facilitator family transporter
VAGKLVAGLLTGSVSVLASAMDSFLDFLISAFNALAVRTAEKPRDAEFNYGRGKIEGLASALEGLFILGSSGYIAYSAVQKLVAREVISPKGLWISAAVMLVSVMVTFSLVTYLDRLKRRTKSLILEADALHYRTDLYSNIGILIALVGIRFTGWQWLDPVIALFISAYVAKAALPILRKGLDMLLDRALDHELVERIESIAMEHSVRVNGIHEIKTRRSGGTVFAEFHLVFDEEITLREAHRISDEIEVKIRKLEESSWVVNIHLDPVDDSHRDRKLAGMPMPQAPLTPIPKSKKRKGSRND